MEMLMYILRGIAYAIINPMFLIMLILVGISFNNRNKKVITMQKIIIGHEIDSALELTMSQVVLGILGGILGSILLSFLGITFNENTAIYILFLISILLVNVNSRYICFSYSGAILGVLAIVNQYVIPNYQSKGIQILDINIISLVSMVGVFHIIEGLLVIVDGSKGAVPIFAKSKEKIIGGFALKRNWALPISIFILMASSSTNIVTQSVESPQWWPILNGTLTLEMLENTIISLLPMYAFIGYNTVTFTKTKKQKTSVSGLIIALYGVVLILISQLATMNMFMQLFAVLFMPLCHELVLIMDKYMEVKGQPKFVSENDGIVILDVAPNTPAYEMGMESGDLLVEINNKLIESEKDILESIREFPNFVWFKIKKKTGELKEVSYNKMNSNTRLGAVLVPKYLPDNENLDPNSSDRFKIILDRVRKNKDK